MAKTLIIEYFEKDQTNPVVPFGLHCIISEAVRRNLEVRLAAAPFELHSVVRRLVHDRNRPTGEEFEKRYAVEEFAALVRCVREEAPNVIGLTTYENYINTVEFLIRLLRRFSDAYFVIGGPLSTALGAKSLDILSADFAFVGESDFCLSDFLSVIGECRPSSRQPHTFAEALEVYRSVAIRGVCPNELSSNVLRLTEAEMENFHLDFEFAIDYLDRKFPTYKQSPTLSYISSRGCPHSCIFCSATLGKNFRKLSASRIVRDLLQVKSISQERFPDREKFLIAFGDDNFVYDRQRSLEFFKIIEEERLNEFFQFSILASVDRFFIDPKHNIVDFELIDRLAGANVRSINFGTDNFCDEELRRLRKPPYTRENIYSLVECLERRSIYNIHNLILSNPYTSPENIRENFQTILELDSRYRFFLQFGPIHYVSPYYGTPIWREIDRNLHKHEYQLRKFDFLFLDEPPDFLMADAVLPLDAKSRAIVEALDGGVSMERYRGIPYFYDFEEALEKVEAFVQHAGTADS